VSRPVYYLPIADEVALFTAAWECRLPVLLRGPTGCGKTRFVEYMAQSLPAAARAAAAPALITVACHEDLTGSDLVGRFLLRGDETVWVDGPLTQAVKQGAICYLDEVVEARKDTIVLIHPLPDHHRRHRASGRRRAAARQPAALLAAARGCGGAPTAVAVARKACQRRPRARGRRSAGAAVRRGYFVAERLRAG